MSELSLEYKTQIRLEKNPVRTDDLTDGQTKTCNVCFPLNIHLWGTVVG